MLIDTSSLLNVQVLSGAFLVSPPYIRSYECLFEIFFFLTALLKFCRREED